MRGGAIPLLAWGTILLVLYTIHAIWDPRGVQIAATAGAVLVIYGGAVALWISGRDALRKGPPPPSTDPLAAPIGSAGAVLSGLSVACILFGLVWARFLVYFGVAMLVLALGRVVVELRAERETRRHVASTDASPHVQGGTPAEAEPEREAMPR
jgi:hypothetical protein